MVQVASGAEYYLANTDDAKYDGTNKYRSFDAAGWWSSGARPCAGNNYTVTNVVVGGTMTSGSDASLATAANWEGDTAPDYVSGALAATFATGGDSADIIGAVAFRGLTFALPAAQTGFSLAKASDDACLFLGDGGVSVPPPTAGTASGVFSVDVPAVLTAAQDWRVAKGTMLGFNAGLAGSANVCVTACDVPDLATDFATLPCVALKGDGSAYTGSIIATNVTLEVAGTNVFGTGTGRTILRATHQGALGSDRCLLRTTGAGVSVTNRLRTEIAPASVVFLFGANTTNAFYRMLETYGLTIGSKAYSSQGRYRSEAGSYTYFGADPSENYSFYGDAQSVLFDGVGTLVFEKGVYNSSGISFGADNVSEKLKVYLRGTDNYGFSVRFYQNCEAHVFAPKALNSRSQYTFDNRTSTRIDGSLDLHGTTQLIWRAEGAGSITSAEPAVFSLCGVNTNMSTWMEADQWNMNLVFGGAVDFVMASGRATLTKVSTSSGELAATNGWIRLAASGDWPNARSVRVEGDGQLTLVDGDNFGEQTEWRIGGNGRVHIPEGVVQTCGKLFFTDVDADSPVKSGIYGSAEAKTIYPGAHVDVHLTGKGLLKVKRPGFTLSIR